MPRGTQVLACRECHQLTYRSRQLHRNRFYEGPEQLERLLMETLVHPIAKLPPRKLYRRLQRLERVRGAMGRFMAKHEGSR
jgi:hypothetical protein